MNSPEMLRQFNEHLNRHAPHRDIETRQVLQYVNDPKYLVIVGIAGPPGPRRPGVWLFFTIAEHTFYDPTVPAKSNQWELIMQLWNDITWGIAVVPTQHQEKLERVAKRKCGLKLSRGIPQVWEGPHPNIVCQGAARYLIQPNAQAMFPLDSRNVRTLEYITKPILTEREEDDQLALWNENAADHRLTNWWPDVVGS